MTGRRRRAGAFALGGCALLLAAAATEPARSAPARARSGASEPPTSVCARAVRRGDRAETLPVDGERRQLLVHVPRGTRARRALPLILMLHGYRSNGTRMPSYTGFSALADRGGFVVAYPSAVRGRWRLNPGEPGARSDLDFMRAAIARVESELCVDTGRVFAAGVSNGGGEVAHMGCQLSDVLDGIATVAGDYRHFGPCRPARALSLLEIHGGRDSVVPYFGARPSGDGSVPGYLALWRGIDRCPDRMVRLRLAPSTTLTRWRCPHGIRVAHLRLDRLGHAWPGSDPPPGRPPGPFSATRRIWDFLRTLPARAALPLSRP